MTDEAAQPASAEPSRLGRIDVYDDVEARQLMLRVGQGDYQAFEVLFQRYHPAVYNFYLKLCRDTQLAEDGVQETFLRLWKAASRYHPSAAFRTYLFQIAKNFWLNEKEKLERRHAVSLDTSNGHGGSASSDGGGMHEQLAGSGQDPHEAAIERERQEFAHELLAELEEKHRMVLVLNLFHGFRYREIAEILEIPEGTVKTRMHHAERKLRQIVKHRNEPGSGKGPPQPRKESASASDHETGATSKHGEPRDGKETSGVGGNAMDAGKGATDVRQG